MIRDSNKSKFQINRLQHIQNALARTIVLASKFKHITLILKSLHLLKVSEQTEYKIKYKIISLTYKILNTTQPSYLYYLVPIQRFQPPHGHNTRSSPFVTLIKPSSSLKVTHLSFRHASPHLWKPASYITQDSSSELFIPLLATFIWTCRFNLLHSAITFHHFFTVSLWAQNLSFQKILSSTLVCFCLSDWSHGSIDRSPDLFAHQFYVLVLFFYFSYSQVRQTKLASSLVNF